MSLSLPWRAAGVKEVGPGQVFWSPWAQTSLMGLRPAAHILQATQLKVPSPPSAPLDLAGAAGKYGGFQDFEDERSVIFSPVPHNQGTRAPRTSEPALRTENRTERVLLSACRLFRAGPGEWQSEWTGFRHRQGPVGGMRAGAELGIPRSLCVARPKAGICPCGPPWPVRLWGATGASGLAVPGAFRRSSSCHSRRRPRAAEAPNT